MKPKKVKKLVLHKETISNLSEDGMNKLRGGDSYDVLCDFRTILCTVTNCGAFCGGPGGGNDTAATKCGTCGGETGYGMCCNNPTGYC